MQQDGQRSGHNLHPPPPLHMRETSHNKTPSKHKAQIATAGRSPPPHISPRNKRKDGINRLLDAKKNTEAAEQKQHIAATDTVPLSSHRGKAGTNQTAVHGKGKLIAEAVRPSILAHHPPTTQCHRGRTCRPLLPWLPTSQPPSPLIPGKPPPSLLEPLACFLLPSHGRCPNAPPPPACKAMPAAAGILGSWHGPQRSSNFLTRSTRAVTGGPIGHLPMQQHHSCWQEATAAWGDSQSQPNQSQRADAE